MLWRITAAINFPVALQALEPPQPGSVFPKKLGLVSRVPAEAILKIEDISISLHHWPGPDLPRELFGAGNEPAALVLRLLRNDIDKAIESFDRIIEPVLDDLSFQLQNPTRIIQLEVLDATPPLTLGEERRMRLYPAPAGYPSAKFLQSMPLGDIQSVFSPTIEGRVLELDSNVRAALRWYVKGLAAPFEVDKFIFWWVGLEILRTESDTSITGPYIARCGHEILNCPTCGKSTDREILGRTIRSFLCDQLGVPTDQADRLWRLRQMLHGASDLTSEAVRDLPESVMILREAVVKGLKNALGVPADLPPLVSSGVPAISLSIWLEGTRKISGFDLAQ